MRMLRGRCHTARPTTARARCARRQRSTWVTDIISFDSFGLNRCRCIVAPARTFPRLGGQAGSSGGKGPQIVITKFIPRGGSRSGQGPHNNLDSTWVAVNSFHGYFPQSPFNEIAGHSVPNGLRDDKPDSGRFIRSTGRHI